MSYTLDIYGPDREKAEKIAKRHGLGILAAFMLLRIGITEAGSIQNYIYPDSDLRVSPFAFKDMKKAVEKIKECKKNNAKIFVFGDKDVDGVTSVATVVNFLEKFGVNVEYSLPVNSESYGISDRAVQDIISSGAKLLITVDVGIKENENVKKLEQHGVDVIITDHHEPPEELPQAFAVINVKCENNFPAQAGELSGCATAFKLCEGVLLSYWQDIDKTFACMVKNEHNINAILVRSLNIEERVTGNADDFDFNSYDYIICHDSQKDFFDNYHKNVKTLEEYFETKPVENFDIFPELLDQAELFSIDATDFLANALIKIQRFLMPSIERFYYDFVDLAGISTICDVMPLTGENRLLVKSAEKKLGADSNEAINSLNLGLNFFRYNEPVTAKRIGNYIGPCINSAGRMGKADISLNLLLEREKQNIKENVKTLLNLNKERKKMGQQAFSTSLLEIGKQPPGNVLIYRSEEIIPGITGVFAQKLAYHYERPAFVFTKDIATGLISGSGRAPGGMNILSIVEKASDYILNFGGHEAACGLSTDEEKYPDLVKRITEISSDDEFKKLPETVISVIAKLNPEDLTMDNIEKFYKAGPYGQGTPDPYFIIENTFLGPVKRFGKPDVHARFKIHDNPFAECLGWSMADEAEKIYNEKQRVSIVFEPEINYFNGKKSLQLNVIKLIKGL